MTMILTALASLAASFVIGFLLGDRRSVKQCNAILDEHWRELMKAMVEQDGAIHTVNVHSIERDEALPAGPTLH